MTHKNTLIIFAVALCFGLAWPLSYVGATEPCPPGEQPCPLPEEEDFPGAQDGADLYKLFCISDAENKEGGRACMPEETMKAEPAESASFPRIPPKQRWVRPVDYSDKTGDTGETR